MVKKIKKKLTPAERARRARQARINFGLVKSKSKKRRTTQMPKKRRVRRKMSKKLLRGAISTAEMLGAGVYGGVRARVSNQLAPVTQRVPLGNISDEVVMFLASWGVGRFFPAARQVAKAGMYIESARIGEAVATGQVGLGGGNSDGNSGTIF